MRQAVKALAFLSTPVLMLFFHAAIFVSDAGAVESLCPGGASRDANVIWCDDFEDGTWQDTWDPSPGKSPEYREAVRCDGGEFGFNSRCSAYSGTLYFDGSWGYHQHYGTRSLQGDHTELYMRAYIRFSDNYRWGNTSDKGIYFENAAQAIPNIKMEYSRWGSGKAGFASYAIPGEVLPQNLGNDIAFQPGRWYLVEFYIRLNTPGAADGIAKLWVDEATGPIAQQTLRASYTNLMIRSAGQTARYNSVFLSDYHQRCESSCPGTVDQSMRWDNFVVSTSRIGPAGAAPAEDAPPGAPTNLRVIP